MNGIRIDGVQYDAEAEDLRRSCGISVFGHNGSSPLRVTEVRCHEVNSECSSSSFSHPHLTHVLPFPVSIFVTIVFRN